MKTKRILHLPLLLVAVGMMLQSCLGNRNVDPNANSSLPNGVVTVKTAADNTVYLQLDEKTTLLPINMKKHPFDGKEVRAMLNYEEVKGEHAGYGKAVNVNWIDSIFTKSLVPHTDMDDQKYGRDPIELVSDPIAGVEDGYLTLRVRMTTMGTGTHKINLVRDVNPKDPYELELRHYAYGLLGGRPVDAYIAFRVKELPATGEKKQKLKLKWRSYTGDRQIELDYSSPVEH